MCMIDQYFSSFFENFDISINKKIIVRWVKSKEIDNYNVFFSQFQLFKFFLVQVN